MASGEEELDDSGPRRQIYVRAKYGKPLQTTVADLLKFFEDAAVGKPTSVLNKWGEEPKAGRLYDLALVTFKKHKAVQRAVGLSGAQLSEREVAIGINNRPPKPRGQASSSCRVFVGNLPFDADEDLLKRTFVSCGRVLFVRFATDEAGSARGAWVPVWEDGLHTRTCTAGFASVRPPERPPLHVRPTGFCHVIFEDKDGKGMPALAAVALDGSEVRGRAISVAPSVAKAKKKRLPKVNASAAPGGGGGAAGLAKEKGKRPAAWRHDREAGLTLPRGPKRPKASSDE